MAGSESTNPTLMKKTLGRDSELTLLLLRLTGFDVAMEWVFNLLTIGHFMNEKNL